MSAALALPLPPIPQPHVIWAQAALGQRKPVQPVGVHVLSSAPVPSPRPSAKPVVTLAFYRKHTESLLRRYLYASMQVGRSPASLADSVGRGWVSSRRVRTFEDAVIFVLDVERCLARLSPLDRQLLSRIVLQEYTQAETADLIGLSPRTVCTRLPEAIDRLTERLLEAELLILPD